jgi:hypothetical protein
MTTLYLEPGSKCKNRRYITNPIFSGVTGRKMLDRASVISLRASGFAGRRCHENQRRRVHTVAKSGRRRAVVEDVPQMRIASAAQYFGTGHVERYIDGGADVLSRDRRPETRPAGVRIELGGRAKERIAAAYAAIDSVAGPFVVLIIEGRFGARMACYLELLGLEQFTPLRVRLDHLRHRRRTLLDARVVEYDDRHHPSRMRRRVGRLGTLHRSGARIPLARVGQLPLRLRLDRPGTLAIRPAQRERKWQPDQARHEPPPRQDFARTIAAQGAVHHLILLHSRPKLQRSGFDLGSSCDFLWEHAVCLAIREHFRELLVSRLGLEPRTL